RPEELRQTEPLLVPRPVPRRLHDGDERPQAERERDEQEVVDRRRRELHTGEIDGGVREDAHLAAALAPAPALAPSLSSRWSPTRSEFAIAVSAGLTAPMLGKMLVSTT